MVPELVDSQILGIRPDTPIYRIFPLWFFEEVLRLRHLVLVAPELWEDPFEILPTQVMVTVKETVPWKQMPLAPHVRPVYVQCWSQTSESDTLWRAYSRVVKDQHFGRNTCPREEGVKVQSTPRKLLLALANQFPNQPASCFVGSVRYAPAKSILQSIANGIGRNGLDAYRDARARAALVLMKREEFGHEQEVRLIFVAEEEGLPDGHIQVQVDPSELFEEVTFDPRLLAFERVERTATARKLGYNGNIEESRIYNPVLLEVVVDRLPGV